MTALRDRADAQLGVLDQLAEDDGRQRLGAERRGRRPAGRRSGWPMRRLMSVATRVGLLQGDVEGGLADDGAAVVEAARRWA